MILRERQADIYDPEMPWVVANIHLFFRINADVDSWIENNTSGDVIFKARRIGFSDYQDALLFYVKFK